MMTRLSEPLVPEVFFEGVNSQKTEILPKQAEAKD